MTVLEQIDAEILRLQDAKQVLARFLDGGGAASKPSRRSIQKPKGRAKAGGGDAVVLAVIRDGAETMKAIASAAKVKPYVAACAVKRLIAAKQVKAEGATSTRRYLAA